MARGLNLTNEQAQKLVDAYPKILAGVQQRRAEARQKTTEQWAADVKADKEIGGDKLISNLSAAQRALDQFGTPELKEYLNTTGLGNHPDLVKTFVKIGRRCLKMAWSPVVMKASVVRPKCSMANKRGNDNGC